MFFDNHFILMNKFLYHIDIVSYLVLWSNFHM